MLTSEEANATLLRESANGSLYFLNGTPWDGQGQFMLDIAELSGEERAAYIEQRLGPRWVV